jgi:hypothetical protein
MTTDVLVVGTGKHGARNALSGAIETMQYELYAHVVLLNRGIRRTDDLTLSTPRTTARDDNVSFTHQ